MIVHTFPHLSLPGSTPPHILVPAAWSRPLVLATAAGMLATAAVVEAAIALIGATR